MKYLMVAVALALPGVFVSLGGMGVESCRNTYYQCGWVDYTFLASVGVLVFAAWAFLVFLAVGLWRAND